MPTSIAEALCTTSNPRSAGQQTAKSNVPVYTKRQEQLGMCGIAILLAIQQIRLDRQEGIYQLRKELQLIAEYPEPDMRRIMRVTLSFLDEDDLVLLRSIQPEVEVFILSGESLAS